MWLDDFRKRVDTQPGWTAVVAKGQSLTYQDLWDRSAASGRARCRDQPGPRHLIAQADSLACLEEVIGAWIHGKVPVVIAPDIPAETQRRVQETIAHDPPAQADPARQEAIIVGTSGSTGLPKLAVLPPGRFNSGLAATARWYDQPEQTQALMAVAIHTSASLISTTLMGLSCGWTLHLFPAGTPGSVLQTHVRAHNIGVINAPPSFYRLFLSYGSGAAFPSLRCTTLGGESVSRALLEHMHAAFPAAKIATIYAMTEAGWIGVLSSRDPRVPEGGCGIP